MPRAQSVRGSGHASGSGSVRAAAEAIATAIASGTVWLRGETTEQSALRETRAESGAATSALTATGARRHAAHLSAPILRMLSRCVRRERDRPREKDDKRRSREGEELEAVSYTHLTLPTKRIV